MTRALNSGSVGTLTVRQTELARRTRKTFFNRPDGPPSDTMRPPARSESPLRLHFGQRGSQRDFPASTPSPPQEWRVHKTALTIYLNSLHISTCYVRIWLSLLIIMALVDKVKQKFRRAPYLFSNLVGRGQDPSVYEFITMRIGDRDARWGPGNKVGLSVRSGIACGGWTIIPATLLLLVVLSTETAIQTLLPSQAVIGVERPGQNGMAAMTPTILASAGRLARGRREGAASAARRSPS